MVDMGDDVVDGGRGGGGEEAVTPSDFERSALPARLFLFLGKCLETKKTCLLILAVTLLLVVELTKLFIQAGPSEGQRESADRVVQLATRVLESLGAHALTPSTAHGPRGAFFANDTHGDVTKV